MGLFDSLRRAVGGGDDGSGQTGERPNFVDVTALGPDEFRQRAENAASDGDPLDFSVASLERLDEAIAAQDDWTEDTPSEGTAYSPKAVQFGSYLGEVLVRTYDGEWTADEGWKVAVAGRDDEMTVAVFEVAARSVAGDPVFAAVAERLGAELDLGDATGTDDSQASDGERGPVVPDAEGSADGGDDWTPTLSEATQPADGESDVDLIVPDAEESADDETEAVDTAEADPSDTGPEQQADEVYPTMDAVEEDDEVYPTMDAAEDERNHSTPETAAVTGDTEADDGSDGDVDEADDAAVETTAVAEADDGPADDTDPLEGPEGTPSGAPSVTQTPSDDAGTEPETDSETPDEESVDDAGGRREEQRGANQTETGPTDEASAPEPVDSEPPIEDDADLRSDVMDSPAGEPDDGRPAEDGPEAPTPDDDGSGTETDPTAGDGIRAEYATEATEFAEFWAEHDLDFTPSSLDRLDDLVGAEWDDDRFEDATFGSDATFDDRAFTSVTTELGGYFGEVLVRALDGEWSANTDHEAVVVVDGTDGRLAVPVFQVAANSLRTVPVFARSYEALLSDLGRAGDET